MTVAHLRIAAALFAFTVLSTPISAENWPQWRGPRWNGTSMETGLPAEWNDGKNVAWKLPLPGPAGASPVVWDDHIFLTTVAGENDEDLVLLCVGTDGSEIWRKVVGVGNEDVRGDEGNSASPSPITDGEHVWSFMANGVIGCYDMQGNEVWHRDLNEAYGPFEIAFGMTATPVLYENQLMFQFLHGDRVADTNESRVVALDKLTGEEIWQQQRVTGAYGENELSYASPVLYDQPDLKLLITHGADFVVAHRLDTGAEVWRCGGLNPHDGDYHETLRFVASPSVAKGIVVVPTAKNGPVVAVKPDRSGDITEDKDAYHWRLEDNTPDVPSPLIHDGLVYLCHENGNLMCLEQFTGKEIYHERTERDRHRASPTFADGKIYLCARNGKVTAVQAGREFKILGQSDMGEEISASPAIANGTIYIRTFENLWAIKQQ